jgi:hypothetical protein
MEAAELLGFRSFRIESPSLAEAALEETPLLGIVEHMRDSLRRTSTTLVGWRLSCHRSAQRNEASDQRVDACSVRTGGIDHRNSGYGDGLDRGLFGSFWRQ